MSFHLSPQFYDMMRDRLRVTYQRDPSRYHVIVQTPDGEARLHRQRPGVYSGAVAALRETPPPATATLDNPSPPRIVEGMRCPGCKRKHTVEVVYGSVSHAGKTWARVVYTCVCCPWNETKGQR